jgi:tripartite-type tricarboxylate transporter receptor subunit TctC
VTTLQRGYFILMVPVQSPYKTVAELTAAMRKKGDKASYGYGSPPALASAELYNAGAGLKALGIAYKTAAASLPEMYRGALDFQFIDSTLGTAQIKGGKLRALAISAGERVEGVDLPTMEEAASIPGFDISPAWGVFLPAGAPEPIVSRLESWFNQIVRSEETKKFLAQSYATPFPGDRKVLTEFIPKAIKKWKEIAKLAKIEPQ